MNWGFVWQQAQKVVISERILRRVRPGCGERAEDGGMLEIQQNM